MSLSYRRLVRAAAGDDSTIRLFNPYVSSIVGEKSYLPELDRLSNVIKGNRAKLDSMREKNNPDKSAPDNEVPSPHATTSCASAEKSWSVFGHPPADAARTNAGDFFPPALPR
jgi:hypothetical protein